MYIYMYIYIGIILYHRYFTWFLPSNTRDHLDPAPEPPGAEDTQYLSPDGKKWCCENHMCPRSRWII